MSLPVDFPLSQKHSKPKEPEVMNDCTFEEQIEGIYVGQKEAVSIIAASIRRKQTGWTSGDSPLVFLFLGASGNGKTELAKQVAKYLHKDNKKAFIRLDMSEYQERHSVSRMIGPPPGYVGHQDGGQLTDALKNCGNAVVLFDEVEKAHPNVLTVFLQLFDEGRLTDGKGDTIECKDSIFIMTTNLASGEIAKYVTRLRSLSKSRSRLRSSTNTQEHQLIGIITEAFKDTIVRPVLKAHFQRDELLGRIDEMVYFVPFADDEIRQIVIKVMEFWATRAKKKNRMDMTWDENVVDLISEGYDIHYGARSIKQEVERKIIVPISEKHYKLKDATQVHVSVNSLVGSKQKSILIDMK